MTVATNNWGQVFVLGYQGLYPTSELVRLLGQYQIGGVIIFSYNIDNPAQLKEVISELKLASSYPLFVMIDQEGGSTNRIKADFPVFPGNSYFGQRGDKEGLREAYSETAKGLRNLGINVNLVPVADVLTNPKNKLLKERSFGSDPEAVANFTKIAIQATKSQKIFACAKHFPGLGNVNLDPHEELPIDKSDLTKLEQVNFVPFKSAIRANVEMIMTTHLLCQKIDPSFPATLSEIFCEEILRRRLKFHGIVITDDMGMGGIARNWELDVACKKAFSVGHDLILLAKDWEKQESILESFGKAVKDKTVNQEKIRYSLNRILKLKAKLER